MVECWSPKPNAGGSSPSFPDKRKIKMVKKVLFALAFIIFWYLTFGSIQNTFFNIKKWFQKNRTDQNSIETKK